jgi:WhiB family redox-sensing transcriptional regulator
MLSFRNGHQGRPSPVHEDDAPGGVGTDRCRQNGRPFSSDFCQCLPDPRSVTSRTATRPYRSVTRPSESALPEEPTVSTSSRLHLSLVPGAASAAPLASPWTDLSPVGDASWRLEALCAETDPEAFFPEKGGSTRDAKRVCSGCTVRAECLEFALANDERFGIWGGLSERERRRLRLQQRTGLSA